MRVDDNLLERTDDEDEDFSSDDEDDNEDFSSDNQSDDESYNQSEEDAQIGNQGRGRDDIDDSAPQSLREARIMEKAKLDSQSKKEELKKTAEAEAASKLVTVCFSLKALSASWGLSALYGNVHLFLKYTVNDKLRGLSLKESMILLLCDVIIMLLIIIQISLIALIVGFIKNPLEAIKSILETVFPNWKNI